MFEIEDIAAPKAKRAPLQRLPGQFYASGCSKSPGPLKYRQPIKRGNSKAGARGLGVPVKQEPVVLFERRLNASTQVKRARTHARALGVPTTKSDS